MDYRTIEKGYLGQINVEKKLIQNGWNLFKPVLENGKVDLIIEKDNKYLRLQIKTVTKSDGRKIIPVRKLSHNMGKYKVKWYTSEDVDYFIGSDLDTDDLYIIPISVIQGIKSSIAISKCSKWKNNFSQMEPNSGNIIGGQDDNVESLTGNADGNDVGME